MLNIVVRRYEANPQQTPHDWTMHETLAGQLEKELRAALWSAHSERGLGSWADRDPEVWVGNACVARLSRMTEIMPFVRGVMARCAAQP